MKIFSCLNKYSQSIRFEGKLALIEKVSDRPPLGARYHKVIITNACAEALLPMLIGARLDLDIRGTTATSKLGIVTSAAIQGSAIVTSGYLFADDLRDLKDNYANTSLSMGLNFRNVRVEDQTADIWRICGADIQAATILPTCESAWEGLGFRFTFPSSAESELSNVIVDTVLRDAEVNGPITQLFRK